METKGLLFKVNKMLKNLENKNNKKKITKEKKKKRSLDKSVKVKILKKSNQKSVYPKDGNTVLVNYRGMLKDGTVFDDSWKKNKPFSFIVGKGQVIRGWDIGIKNIKLGEKATIKIPSKLGYGEKGVPGHIPPNSPLIFKIHLMRID